MAERTYVVGLPVIVTVNDDDGSVTYEIDTSETSQGMAEDFDQVEDPPTENQMLLDSAIVDAMHKGRPAPTVKLEGMEMLHCPVRYGCEFSLYSIEEMAHHIEAFDHSDADAF